MTLADLLPSLPLSYAEGREVGLLFAADLAERLEVVQRAIGSQCRVVPTPAADGRYVLCGDVLSEVGPGGLFAAGFARLDTARLSEVDVIAWSTARAMLPTGDGAGDR